MALLAKYYEKKRLMDNLSKELKALEDNDGLKKEIKFKDEMLALLKKHDLAFEDAFKVLATEDPSLTTVAGGRKSNQHKGKPRPLQTFKNPHTGEVVETRGANHKTLKGWRAEHGADTVRQWRQD